MKDNFNNRVINLNNSGSGLGCLLTLIIMGLIIGAVGWQFIINSILFVIALVVIIPIIGLWAFRWWLKRNLVEDNCPVCDYRFTGFNNADCRCPNCGEVLTPESGKFIRKTPPGIIDVDAVEVSKQPKEIE